MYNEFNCEFQRERELKLQNCIEEFQKENAMEDVEITEEMVQKQCRKMSNWKAPGRDGAQCIEHKYRTSLDPRIVKISRMIS